MCQPLCFLGGKKRMFQFLNKNNHKVTQSASQSITKEVLFLVRLCANLCVSLVVKNNPKISSEISFEFHFRFTLIRLYLPRINTDETLIFISSSVFHLPARLWRGEYQWRFYIDPNWAWKKVRDGFQVLRCKKLTQRPQRFFIIHFSIRVICG